MREALTPGDNQVLEIHFQSHMENLENKSIFHHLAWPKWLGADGKEGRRPSQPFLAVINGESRQDRVFVFSHQAGPELEMIHHLMDR